MLSSDERNLLEVAQNAIQKALDAVEEFGDKIVRRQGDQTIQIFVGVTDTARCRIDQAKDKMQEIVDICEDEDMLEDDRLALEERDRNDGPDPAT